MYFFVGVSVVVGCGLGVTAYFVTKGSASILYKSLVWGTFFALVATPTNTLGGNGTSSAVALFDIVTSGFGADPAYAIGAFKRLLLSVPLFFFMVAIALLIGRRLT